MKEETVFRRIALLFWSWVLLVPALICVLLLAVFKLRAWTPIMGTGVLDFYRVLIVALPAWGWIQLLGAGCGVVAILPPHRASLWKAIPPVLLNTGWAIVWILSLVASHRGEWNFYSW